MTIATVATPAKRYTVRDEVGRIIGKAELRSVAVKTIRRDSAYQRDVSEPWINHHLPFDVRQAGAIVLSARAGGPYVIDGGHRLALAIASGVGYINAFVIEGLAQQDEARLFTKYQRERRNLTSHALFRADKVALDPETLAIVHVVNNAGFTINDKKTNTPNNISAIDAVRYIHRYGGDDLLARTLDLVRRLWIGEEKALSAQVLKGTALFLQSAGREPTFKRELLERVMVEIAPTKLLRLAQGIAERRRSVSSSAANVAEALLESYNKKIGKDGLPLGALKIGDKRRPSR